MCLYLLEVNTDERRESTLGFSGMHTASNLVGMTQPSVSFVQSCSCAHARAHTDTVHVRTGFCIFDSPPAEIFVSLFMPPI